MASIAATARECVISLDRCLGQAHPVLPPQDATLIEDQLGRFSIWAGNIGVFARGRASMDHRLREAPDIQRLVVGLVNLVKSRTDDCKSRAESYHDASCLGSLARCVNHGRTEN